MQHVSIRTHLIKSPPSLLVGTPKPGFGRTLFPKAHFEPTGLVFPEEGKKNPERGFTGGWLPPLVFRRRKEIWSGRGVQGSQAAAMPEGGKKKLPEGLGVGGFHTHEPLGGGRKDGTQGGVRGYKASRGGYITTMYFPTTMGAGSLGPGHIPNATP